MLFELFTHPLYIATEFILYFALFLQIYILWREYRFLCISHSVPHEVAQFMSETTFDKLKEFHRRMVLIDLLGSLFLTLVRVIFSDELSHISLWKLSTDVSIGSREGFVTCVFIFLTTCKDFCLHLPVEFYFLYVEEESDLQETLEELSLQFCAQLVSQMFVFHCFVWLCQFATSVSNTCIICSILVLIVGLEYIQEVLLFDPFIDENKDILNNRKIMKQLRPFLKRMNFSSNQIFVYDDDGDANAFTVGHEICNNQKVFVEKSVVDSSNSFTNKEGASIIMHELGHVYYNHTTEDCINDILVSGAYWILFFLFHEHVRMESFGFTSAQPMIASILIRMDLLVLFNMLSHLYIMTTLRGEELEADQFSYLFNGRHYRSGLIKMHMNDPQLPVHDRWYSMWTHEHPSLVDRLKFLSKKR